MIGVLLVLSGGEGNARPFAAAARFSLRAGCADSVCGWVHRVHACEVGRDLGTRGQLELCYC